jgi:hypothetical protein
VVIGIHVLVLELQFAAVETGTFRIPAMEIGVVTGRVVDSVVEIMGLPVVFDMIVLNPAQDVEVCAWDATV